MNGAAAGALRVIITVAIPLIAVGATTAVVTQPWIVGAVYSTPGFPDDRFGMPDSDRAELAREGVRAVAPLGPGADSLERAALPGGAPAFTASEVEHMRDVRDLLLLISAAWLTAIAAAWIAALALRKNGLGESARRAAARGGLVTIAAIALTGLAMLVDFDSVFTGFHGLFFEEGTWTFATERTLIRIYPESFWAVAAVIAASLTVAQGIAAWQIFSKSGHSGTKQRKVR